MDSIERARGDDNRPPPAARRRRSRAPRYAPATPDPAATGPGSRFGCETATATPIRTVHCPRARLLGRAAHAIETDEQPCVPEDGSRPEDPVLPGRGRGPRRDGKVGPCLHRPRNGQHRAAGDSWAASRWRLSGFAGGWGGSSPCFAAGPTARTTVRRPARGTSTATSAISATMIDAASFRDPRRPGPPCGRQGVPDRSARRSRRLPVRPGHRGTRSPDRERRGARRPRRSTGRDSRRGGRRPADWSSSIPASPSGPIRTSGPSVRSRPPRLRISTSRSACSAATSPCRTLPPTTCSSWVPAGVHDALSFRRYRNDEHWAGYQQFREQFPQPAAAAGEVRSVLPGLLPGAPRGRHGGERRPAGELAAPPVAGHAPARRCARAP